MEKYLTDAIRRALDLAPCSDRALAEEAGLAHNTIVVYASDQGFYLGDYGWYDKRWIYEPSLRTPLIVKWPGTTEPGARNEDIVLNLDFAQTFLDLAGAGDPGESYR
ncbi:MAG: sulfatase-like hydrolase/transferase [Candidatus Hydrogenedentes bacterium]|nr:sulfatase-like hydrolase/transferase [Candidatus Hydrogenedentota bacterium]